MMRLNRLVWAVLLALAPAAALAEAPEALLQHHGRLLGSSNAPVTGTKSLIFSLFHGPSSGEPAWSDTRAVDLDASGTYALTLGDSTDGAHPKLPWTLFDGTPLYLSVTIDGVELSPRLPLVDVPTANLARHALTADNVDCQGCLLPEALAGGIPADKLQPIPIDHVTGDLPGNRLAAGSVTKDKLDGSGCSDGQMLKWNAQANGWACAADVDTTVGAGSGLSLAAGALSIGTRAVTSAMLASNGCADGELLKWNAAGNTWLCAPDVGHDYVAGTGLALSGSTFSLRPGSVDGSLLAPGAVTPDKLSPNCGIGQILKMTPDGWSCGTDLVGTTSSGGLSQVAVNAPLTGDGTSGSALGLTDGGILTAKLADGAVTAAKLDATMRKVTVSTSMGSSANGYRGTVTAEIDGVALAVPPITAATGSAIVLVVFDAAGSPTAETYNIVSPTSTSAVITRLDGLAAGTGALVIGVGRLWVAPPVPNSLTAKLASYGFADGAHIASVDPIPTVVRSWVGAMVAGAPRESREWVGMAGLNSNVTLRGWVLDGRFVSAGHRPSTLVDLDGGALLSQPGDGSLALQKGQTFQLGYGIVKEANAGKIGYQTFSDSLDLVGAGTDGTNRKIKLWAEGGTTTTGNLTIGGSLSVSGSITQPGWNNVAFQSGYANWGTPYTPTQYYRDTQGLVHVRGFVRFTSPPAATVFNFPAGYRPEYREVHLLPAGCGGTATTTRVDVTPTGDLIFDGTPASCQWLVLDGMTFRAAGY